MRSIIRHITVNCPPAVKPYDLAAFWSKVLGCPVDPNAQIDDDEVIVLGGKSGPDLLFIQVADDKIVRNRVHLDLQPERPRDQEVQRIIELGAVELDDRRTPDGKGWVVLADPAGNEFCIERSAAERAAD